MPDPAIQFEQVSFAYPGADADRPPVLRGVSFSIPAGQSVALVGVNGSGKSTLLRHLIGLAKPSAGRVCIQGVDTAGASPGALAHHVGFAFQKPEHQLFSATVREEVAFGPRNLGLRGEALVERVTATLERFGLAERAEHPPAVLSFSLRRLVALASVAALGAPILALDEPLVGLDGLWRRRVIAWLNGHHEAGGTTLLVTHHLRLAAKAERMIVLKAGRILADGPPVEVFDRRDVLAEAGLPEPFSVGLGHALDLPGPTLTVRGVLQALQSGRPPADNHDAPGLFTEDVS